MERPLGCPVCGHPMKAQSNWVDRCGECRFLRSSLPAGPGTGIGGLEPLRRANFEEILDRVQASRPLAGARVLEVGSAWGWFLQAAARRGAIVHGIEGERANAEKSVADGFSVEHGLFPDDLNDKGPYDFIVFNDVFEHIAKPELLCRKIEVLLKPGGLLVLNLPTTDGALFRIASLLARVGVSSPYERVWQKGFASPHVSMFNHANLVRMVQRHTTLREEMTFPLPCVIRDGLGERVRSSYRGLAATVMLAGLWALTFLLPRLPPDVIVAVFRAPGGK